MDVLDAMDGSATVDTLDDAVVDVVLALDTVLKDVLDVLSDPLCVLVDV